MIVSKSKSNVRLISAIARKLGDEIVPAHTHTYTHHASEAALAKEWLTPQEDRAWQDL